MYKYTAPTPLNARAAIHSLPFPFLPRPPNLRNTSLILSTRVRHRIVDLRVQGAVNPPGLVVLAQQIPVNVDAALGLTTIRWRASGIEFGLRRAGSDALTVVTVRVEFVAEIRPVGTRDVKGAADVEGPVEAGVGRGVCVFDVAVAAGHDDGEGVAVGVCGAVA
jgi:hypothetical protein